MILFKRLYCTSCSYLKICTPSLFVYTSENDWHYNLFSYCFMIFDNWNFRIVQATALWKENTWYFYLGFFILDIKMMWKNETTKFLMTTNSMHMQAETNNNKNLGVCVQTLCFGDGLSTRDKCNYWRWLKKKYIWHIVNFLRYLTYCKSLINLNLLLQRFDPIIHIIHDQLFSTTCFTQSICHPRYC